jgi:hypothetical protein
VSATPYQSWCCGCGSPYVVLSMHLGAGSLAAAHVSILVPRLATSPCLGVTLAASICLGGGLPHLSILPTRRICPSWRRIAVSIYISFGDSQQACFRERVPAAGTPTGVHPKHETPQILSVPLARRVGGWRSWRTAPDSSRQGKEVLAVPTEVLASGFQRAADELWPRREACAVSDEDRHSSIYRRL